jgi:hypothetical protein
MDALGLNFSRLIAILSLPLAGTRTIVMQEQAFSCPAIFASIGASDSGGFSRAAAGNSARAQCH